MSLNRLYSSVSRVSYCIAWGWVKYYCDEMPEIERKLIGISLYTYFVDIIMTMINEGTLSTVGFYFSLMSYMQDSILSLQKIFDDPQENPKNIKELFIESIKDIPTFGEISIVVARRGVSWTLCESRIGSIMTNWLSILNNPIDDIQKYISDEIEKGLSSFPEVDFEGKITPEERLNAMYTSVATYGIEFNDHIGSKDKVIDSNFGRLTEMIEIVYDNIAKHTRFHTRPHEYKHNLDILTVSTMMLTICVFGYWFKEENYDEFVDTYIENSLTIDYPRFGDPFNALKNIPLIHQ